MNLRTRVRRLWTGRDLYDHAASTLAAIDNAETEGRDRAYAKIREIHAKYPNTERRCSVPNCCQDIA